MVDADAMDDLFPDGWPGVKSEHIFCCSNCCSSYSSPSLQDEGVDVWEMLSSIYNLNKLVFNAMNHDHDHDNNTSTQNPSTLFTLCSTCEQLLLQLYFIYCQFNDLRQLDSQLDKEIKRVDEILLNYSKSGGVIKASNSSSGTKNKNNKKDSLKHLPFSPSDGPWVSLGLRLEQMDFEEIGYKPRAQTCTRTRKFRSQKPTNSFSSPIQKERKRNRQSKSKSKSPLKVRNNTNTNASKQKQTSAVDNDPGPEWEVNLEDVWNDDNDNDNNCDQMSEVIVLSDSEIKKEVKKGAKRKRVPRSKKVTRIKGEKSRLRPKKKPVNKDPPVEQVNENPPGQMNENPPSQINDNPAPGQINENPSGQVNENPATGQIKGQKSRKRVKRKKGEPPGKSGRPTSWKWTEEELEAKERSWAKVEESILVDDKDSKQPMYKCIVVGCGADFNFQKNLEKHEKTSHKRGPFVCGLPKLKGENAPKCQITAKTLDLLRAHQKSALHKREDKTRIRCLECGSIVSNIFQFHVHFYKMHTAEGQRIAKEESKRAIVKKRATREEKDAGGFICDICQVDFITKIKLTAHRRDAHDDFGGIKPHVCEICGKKLPGVYRLKRHVLLVHTDEKPFVCSYCGRRYKSESGLNEHVKRTHDEEGRLRYNKFIQENNKRRKLIADALAQRQALEFQQAQAQLLLPSLSQPQPPPTLQEQVQQQISQQLIHQQVQQVHQHQIHMEQLGSFN